MNLTYKALENLYKQRIIKTWFRKVRLNKTYLIYKLQINNLNTHFKQLIVEYPTF